eukprot:6183138-Pleurochrysis_carterae.AAC.6
MGNGVVPKCGGCLAGNHRGARELDDAPDSALGDTVQLVHVRGHVVTWTPLAERKAANLVDRNSPALSL